jgi:predicted negative regulator of RcsB-dependent stress response
MRRAWMVAGLVLAVTGCAGMQAHDTPGTERHAGAQPQYEKYRALVRQRTAADEAAVVTQDAADFRLWGPGPWP